MATSSSSSGGIGIAGAIGVLFIGLKLANVIQWSWWWVLSPFWIPAAIGVVVLIVALVIAAVAAIAKA